ncbi:uncharacterized protein LOC8262099 isoform X2 [Ricinus communis]|uniref:Uncharacterized protein n=1 Tax=Ricinus communis TaxID=3988 RepID=B9RW32_RICCO|nr:uncharacterized protein LOC8262099 isoform X2 [Ricinus communis]EEF44469.1 protein with unknown function [Ricinus communis]|eukprot:XP_025012886.1 uncharacterized protein LOC8262099 isoform X2 [Ricinus communis]
MFDILFGWRKASKCKRLIKRVQCRLELLKSKRHSIVRQLREDVAQLIKIGYDDIACNRAEHLFNDETTVSIYELLENFCEFVIAHLSYIRRHKDCPNDINEAVSSLIFASARCGDLPELRAIRKLFGERYGQRFAMTALELLPGNLVNLQIKEKLSINSVPDDVKRKLVDEIARDYCLRPEILAIEYTSELQQQVKEHDGTVGSCKVVTTNADGMERNAIHADGISTIMNLTIHSGDQNQDDMISTCISSSIVEQSSSDTMESPKCSFAGLRPKFEAVASNTKGSQITRRANIPATDQDEVRKMTAASSESLPQFPEEMIVYLDDVEEVQHSIAKEGSSHDQSIFKFKSTILNKNKEGEGKYMDPYESCSDCSSSSSTRRRVKAAKKRTRRRSLSRENLTVKDIHCVIYYEKPNKRSTTPGSHLRNKHYRENFVRSKEHSFHGEKRRNQPQSCQCFNPEAEDCCLNNLCYFCTGDGRDTKEVHFLKHDIIPHGLERKGDRNYFRCCECSKIIVESDADMERYSYPPRPQRRSCDFGDIEHDSFTNAEVKPYKQSKTTKGKANGFDSPGRDVATNDSLTRNVTKPPYLRAMTMPQERSKGSQGDDIFRYSRSFPAQTSNHVHPKLPDYDEIAAKFIALKKEHLQNKTY